MSDTLKTLVRLRSKARCEYCRMPEGRDFLDFELDHIIAQKHRGETSLENLAFACFHCNSHKGPNLAGFDTISGRVVRLFHPRKDRWNQHFSWDGPMLLGKTAIGRVTIDVLNINDLEFVDFRELLIQESQFP
jgi:hypothetical protein